MQMAVKYKIVGYKVAKSTTSEGLEKAVMNLLSKGFKLHGELKVADGGMLTKPALLQVMVKYAPR